MNVATNTGTGTIHGVGLGPGDPELMSVRADRLVRGARHVAYFRKTGREGQARRIVAGMLRPDVIEFPMEYPVTTEIPLDNPRYNRVLSAFYEGASRHLLALAREGEDVVVLAEGDPFFYGSFMHLFTRLDGQVPVSVTPGVTGMSAAWTATGKPISWGDDVVTVLMGTLPEAELLRRMQGADAIVIMKIGRNFGKVCGALAKAGLWERAWLVEHASMEEQRVVRLAEFSSSDAPYFSIILVHGEGRRP
ncbi:MAG TPA: precorrin-2 C(20)-methyltransferase [Paracoccaceae bacterium]|nr:precorrin-2 C(20)-methyltransferase [Paracoccaceae bacterium]